MKKFFKIFGIIIAVIGMIMIVLFEVASVDHYIDSKLEKFHVAQSPQQDCIMLPPVHIELNKETSVDISEREFKITLIATPEEFAKYLNSISNDGINQIVIKGESVENDKIKWSVWTTNKPNK